MSWLGGALGSLLGLSRREPPGGRETGGRPAGHGEDGSLVVDSRTRTFWWPGSPVPATLVETLPWPDGGPPRRRVAALVASHDLRDRRPGGSGPSAAFSEAMLVELMRAGRYERAFALLAPQCQRRWGSPAAFAAEHRGRSLSRLLGASVTAVRRLQAWTDPEDGSEHRDVAELDVAYLFETPRGPQEVERTVHLVAIDGRWRSLCYPSRPAAQGGRSSGGPA